MGGSCVWHWVGVRIDMRGASGAQLLYSLSCRLALGQDITRTSRFFVGHHPPHVYLSSHTWLFLPGLPLLFLHTASDQKLAWRWEQPGNEATRSLILGVLRFPCFWRAWNLELLDFQIWYKNLLDQQTSCKWKHRHKMFVAELGHKKKRRYQRQHWNKN